MEDQEKPFLSHLEDLRWVLIKIILTVGASMGVACLGAREIIALLRLPLMRAIEGTALDSGDFLKTLGVTDALNIILQTGLFAGLIFAFPIVVWILVDYLLPALHPKERRLLVPAFLVGGFLFLVGALFCYFLVLPAAIGFFIELNSYLGTKAEWTIEKYLGFVLQMLFAFGVAFEMPLVITILARLGIVHPTFLSQYRRHAVVVIVIVAAAITPTSDPFNLAMLAVPMVVLYEVSIISSRLFYPKDEEPATQVHEPISR